MVDVIVLFQNHVQTPSLAALQDWVSSNDIQRYEILLCVGNKVDLVPGHPVHSEYRRRLLNVRDSSSVSNLELADYGISETEGSSLLGDDGPSWEVRRSCLEWCAERNIEYIEACASNVDFDKCKITLPSIVLPATCLDVVKFYQFFLRCICSSHKCLQIWKNLLIIIHQYFISLPKLE